MTHNKTSLPIRKPLIIGILRETMHTECRAPLTPMDVAWLKRRFIEVEVESNPKRAYSDRAYKKAGATIVNRFKKASLLIGVKEPKVSSLYPGKIYMLFPHTSKGQPENMPLLRSCIRKNITLIDYEKITDTYGKRTVYFGKFAGICGVINSLHYLGKKLDTQGIKNPFSILSPAYSYRTLKKVKDDVAKMSASIRQNGFDKRLTPFVIGISGHGNVSKGVQEILGILNPIEVHPKDMKRFVTRKRKVTNRVYQIIFHREEKFRAKDNSGFYFEEYLRQPKKFISNMDRYLAHINILFHASYWDERYPRLVTKKMITGFSRKHLRLAFIADLSCDINGSVELTYKATTREAPTYTYNPRTKHYKDGYDHNGITILARDNLPADLPREASIHFSLLIREYVYQIAVHGVADIINHVAIPKEVRNAVIVQKRHLTKPFAYLKKYI